MPSRAAKLTDVGVSLGLGREPAVPIGPLSVNEVVFILDTARDEKAGPEQEVCHVRQRYYDETSSNAFELHECAIEVVQVFDDVECGHYLHAGVIEWKPLR